MEVITGESNQEAEKYCRRTAWVHLLAGKMKWPLILQQIMEQKQVQESDSA